jgi:hypothetical protein
MSATTQLLLVAEATEALSAAMWGKATKGNLEGTAWADAPEEIRTMIRATAYDLLSGDVVPAITAAVLTVYADQAQAYSKERPSGSQSQREALHVVQWLTGWAQEVRP